MPLTNPLDLITPAFVALRDTLVDAKQRSREQLRSWFTTHVAPLDELMRTIYDDYSTGFGKLSELLESGADPEEAVALLKDLRLVHVRDRKDVDAIATEIAEARRRRLFRRGLGMDFYQLFLAVQSFTVAASPEDHLSFYTDFIKRFQQLIEDKVSPFDSSQYAGSIVSPRGNAVLDVIDRLDLCRQELMPDAWSKYSHAYQRVSLACV
jgi:hypothetical protein